jgi:hypothetical protein
LTIFLSFSVNFQPFFEILGVKLFDVENFAKCLHSLNFFGEKIWGCEKNGWPPQKVPFAVAFRAAKKNVFRDQIREKRARASSWPLALPIETISQSF